jgi:hypothetical protein
MTLSCELKRGSAWALVVTTGCPSRATVFAIVRLMSNDEPPMVSRSILRAALNSNSPASFINIKNARSAPVKVTM